MKEKTVENGMKPVDMTDKGGIKPKKPKETRTVQQIILEEGTGFYDSIKKEAKK